MTIKIVQVLMIEKQRAQAMQTNVLKLQTEALIPGRQGYHGCVPNYSGHLPRYPATFQKIPFRSFQ